MENNLLLGKRRARVLSGQKLEDVAGLSKLYNSQDESLTGVFSANKDYQQKWDLSRYRTEEEMFEKMPILNERVVDNQMRLNALLGTNIDAMQYIQDNGVSQYEEYLNESSDQAGSGARILRLQEIKDQVGKEFNLDSEKLNLLMEHPSFAQGAFGMVGAFWGSMNPVRFTSDLLALTSANAFGKGVAGIAMHALPILAKYTGIPGVLSEIVLDALALGGSDMVLNTSIINHRRKELGLPEVDVLDSAEEAVVGGLVFGAGLQIAKPVLKQIVQQSKILGKKIKLKPLVEQTPEERSISQMADSMEHRNRLYPDKTDADLAETIKSEISSDIPAQEYTGHGNADGSTVAEFVEGFQKVIDSENTIYQPSFKDRSVTLFEEMFGSEGYRVDFSTKKQSEFLDDVIGHLNKSDNLIHQYEIEYSKGFRSILNSEENRGKTFSFDEFAKYAYGETGFKNDAVYSKLLGEMNRSNRQYVDWLRRQGVDVGFLENRLRQTWDRRKIMADVSGKEFVKDFMTALDWDAMLAKAMEQIEKEYKAVSENAGAKAKAIEGAKKKYATEEGRSKYLKDIHESIRGNGTFISSLGKGEKQFKASRIKSLEQPRALWMKDAESYLALNEKYGRFKDLESVLESDYRSKARIQTQLELMGKDARDFFRKVQEVYDPLTEGEETLSARAKLSVIKWMAESLNGESLGLATPFVKDVADSALNIKISSFLSGLQVVALIGDFLTNTFRGTTTGLGMTRTISGYVKSLFGSGITPIQADALRIALEGSRMTARELSGKSNFTDKISRATHKFSGVDAITSRGRRAFSTAFLSNLSGLVENATKEISPELASKFRGDLKKASNLIKSREKGSVAPKEYREFFNKLAKDYGVSESDVAKLGEDFFAMEELEAGLRDYSHTGLTEKGYEPFYENLRKEYGIDAEDLVNLRRYAVKVPLGKKGASLLDYSGLNNPKTEKTFKKIAIAHSAEVNHAISRTRLSYRAVPGDNALIKGLFFLTKLPIQISMDNLVKPLLQKRYGYASSFLASSILGGALVYTTKQFIAGKKVDPSNKDFWLQAFKLGEAGGLLALNPEVGLGILGAFSDDYSFLLEIGKQLSGGGSERSRTNQSNLAKKAVRVAQSYTPFHTHPLFKALLDRFVFDNLQLALDPEAKEHWSGQELKMRKRGQEWIFRGMR